MSNQSRQPAGVPTGGRFAAQSHAEVEITLSDDLRSDAPQWGPELNTRFTEAVDSWIEDNPEGAETTVLELLDMTEADAVDAYGSHRARWISGLGVSAVINSYQTQGASFHGPDEYADEGHIEVYDASKSNQSVVVSTWGDGDGPDIGHLTRRCPIDSNGERLFDRSDPLWDQNRFPGNYPNLWSDAGFKDPAVAAQWSNAGFGNDPSHAAEWDEAGFGPKEASSHVFVSGTRLWQAKRDRAVRFATDLADAEASLAEPGRDRSGAA